MPSQRPIGGSVDRVGIIWRSTGCYLHCWTRNVGQDWYQQGRMRSRRLTARGRPLGGSDPRDEAFRESRIPRPGTTSATGRVTGSPDVGMALPAQRSAQARMPGARPREAGSGKHVRASSHVISGPPGSQPCSLESDRQGTTATSRTRAVTAQGLSRARSRARGSARAPRPRANVPPRSIARPYPALRVRGRTPSRQGSEETAGRSGHEL